MELTEQLVTLFGGTDVAALGGGHQSRVFRVVRDNGQAVVAKVLDAAMTNRDELEVRVDTIAALADLDPQVCRPVPVDHALVTALTIAGGVYVVGYEFAEGTALTPSDPEDAELMGRTLSQLHRSMSRLPPTSLPLIGALRSDPPDTTEPHQMLHGDFNATNLRRQRDGIVRVFDLDDCGYGPPLFDVANALYMELFEAIVHDASETYRTFREAFVSGYSTGAGRAVDADELDHFIDVRVDALQNWLDDLGGAPVGIRTSSPAWRATLRSFVATYRGLPRRP
jgi:Ser/Thr protein kinase RdoA (MazF antagonist)